MATLSSHLLNSVNGTHASNVDIIIYQIKSNGEKKIVSEITVKFKMLDPNKKYHIPIIISPNGYSIWWSD